MTAAADRLSFTFYALSDPTRRRILSRLARGEATVNELARPFRMTLPAVSKHLKVLEKARLIRRGRNAQYRPCELDAAPLKEAADWVEQYRLHWDENFGRLDQVLKELQTDKGRK